LPTVLGDSLGSNRIEAIYTNGVLTVQLPIAEQAKPRTVEIGADDGDTAIPASSTSN
jgi:HSP20 family protein